MVKVEDIKNECALMRTRMASRSLTRAYDEAMRPIGLKATQVTLLGVIKLGAPNSISMLANILALERTTLTRNLQLLARDGLIEIGPEGYRRARALSLTDAGEEKLAQALPLWRKAQDRLVAALGAEQWNDTRQMLERLAAAI